jgi:AcrR family transcriptional regulator
MRDQRDRLEPVHASETLRSRPGRPRSERAHREILDATRELITERGFAELHLEHVAARAGVGKATIYRRWASKEALVLELLLDLAAPFLEIPDLGDTRRELRAAVDNAVRGLTTSEFGPVMRTLLGQIASNPRLGDPFRATVVQARRREIAGVVRRGVQRGDLRAATDPAVATELLIGPVYYRLVFGGRLDGRFAARIVDAYLEGASARSVRSPLGASSGGTTRATSARPAAS